MRPIALTLKGLRSYREETRIDFDGLNLFAVIGDTGAGKSTLIEALSFVLYARKTWIGGKLEDLIAEGQTKATAELVFEAADEVWTVTRTRSSGTSGSVDRLARAGDSSTVDGADAVTAKVESLLGLDHSQFINAVVMRQGNFDKLLTLKKSERTALLSSIFNLDHLSVIRDWAVEELSSWKGKLDVAVDRRGRLPLDPAAALAASEAAAAEARQRVEVLSSLTTVVGELEAVQASSVNAAQRLRERRSLVPSGAGEAVGRLVELAGLGRELTEAHAIAETTRVAAETSLAGAVEAERAALAGFASRDEAVRVAQLLRTAADDLGPAIQRLADAQGAHGALVAPSAVVDGALVTAVDAAVAAEGVAERDAEAAQEARERARRAWAELASAREDRRRADEDVRDATAAQKAAATEQESAAEALTTAERTVTEATRAREDAMRADAVAHAVEGMVAGDACPICDHAVDAAHLERHRRSGSDDSVARLAAAVDDRRRAESALATAKATLDAASKRLVEVTERIQVLDARVAAAVSTAGSSGVDLEGGDEASALAAVLEAVAAAQQRVTAARSATTDARARLTAAQTEVDVAQKTYETERVLVERERQQAESALAAVRARLGVVPAGFAVSPDASPDDLRATAVRVDGVLDGLTAASGARADAERSLEEAKSATAVLQDRARADVLDPARAAVATLRSWSARITDLLADVPDMTEAEEVFSMLEDPRKAAEVEDLAGRATVMVAIGHQVLAGADVRVAELTSRVADAVAAIEQALGEAGVGSSAELARELGGATGVVQQTSAAITQAEADRAAASRLDQQIAALQPVCAGLETLKASLTTGAFLTHLLDSRTEELLVEAGRRLGEITSGRYDFAKDFSIVDTLTGATRSPEMLSGGERFQAALALSLGLIEITSRGGGRLGAVFVDEGFGSLDANALDRALDTLGGVAGGGKVVGLVSHLHRVAEYVDTVFHVVKDDVRGSLVQRLDGAEREALLSDEGGAGLSV